MPQSATLARVEETRLTEVEIRYTYLEQLVKDMSQVMHQQQQTIDLLSTRIERLEQVIADAMNQSGESLPHEKPPHY
jgi:uncharacterized coiled-coil protein SlyX